MLYFAYGSNMATAQMTCRCPAAVKVGSAVLANHQLVFNRLSKNRGCGVASILPSPRSEVWGVVYRMTEACFLALDKSEGYVLGRQAHHNGYNRHPLSVLMGDVPTAVETYIAVPTSSPPLPNEAYLTLIRSGAAEHELPETYQTWLANLPDRAWSEPWS